MISIKIIFFLVYILIVQNKYVISNYYVKELLTKDVLSNMTFLNKTINRHFFQPPSPILKRIEPSAILRANIKCLQFKVTNGDNIPQLLVFFDCASGTNCTLDSIYLSHIQFIHIQHGTYF